MDAPTWLFIRKEIQRQGLLVMDHIWDNGFRRVTQQRVLSTAPATSKDMKIRVPVSPLWTSMFQALGAAPASINFSETYSALQTRIVDGQENPLAIIRTRQALRSAEVLLA